MLDNYKTYCSTIFHSFFNEYVAKYDHIVITDILILKWKSGGKITQ